MDNDTNLDIDPETGYFKYPERPEQLPDESEYPRKYTVKVFSKKEIDEYRYYRSIRGYSLSRLEKGEVNVLLDDGTTEAKPGWIPNESGLIFRSMQIGLVKTTGWSIVERNTGISLMPSVKIEKEPIGQLSFDFTPSETKTKKATGSNRDKALTLASNYVAAFTKQQWIEIQEKLIDTLAGIEYELIRTPEQEAIENEWEEKCGKVNDANNLKRDTHNFLVTYKNLRVHQHSKDRPLMTEKNGLVRVAEKLNPKKKIKFFFGQEDYGNAIEVEGVLLPIDIDGLTELKDLVIVKGDQFKNTPVEEMHTKSKYYVYDPYMGLACTAVSTSLKGAKESALERLMIRVTPESINGFNARIQLHNEKILAAQSGKDITHYL